MFSHLSSYLFFLNELLKFSISRYICIVIIELNISDKKAKSFISFLEELDFVTIKTKTDKKEMALSDADVIFGTSKPATDNQLKNYLTNSYSEETKELSMVCEDVIDYLDKKK